MPINKLRKRLGDLLVEEGIVSEAQLEQALNAQKNTGRRLGDTLISLGFLSETQLLNFLAQQLSLPVIDLSRAHVDIDAVPLLPEVHARRLRALVIGRSGDTLRIAMSDPADLFAQEALLNQLPDYGFEFVIAPEKQLVDGFDVTIAAPKKLSRLPSNCMPNTKPMIVLILRSPIQIAMK